MPLCSPTHVDGVALRDAVESADDDDGGGPVMQVVSSESAVAIVSSALAVESPADLDLLWDRLRQFAPYDRPVGDRWGNRALLTAAGGNFDHKLVELVTNMFDAVIYRRLLSELGVDAVNQPGFETLYDDPRSAALELFKGASSAQMAEHARVELRSGGTEKRLRTVVFRDFGIGMSAEDLPDTLYRVGSSRKDGVLWQMGAFGRGGLTVLSNCHGWVVVSRPAQTAGTEADSVVVSIVRWRRTGNRQTETALYQVTAPWESVADRALPAKFPATCAPDFLPGTQLSVVGFQPEGIGVSRLGDEKSLDTVLDTRLFETSMAVAVTAPVLKDRERVTVLRGLGNRMADNPRPDRREGREELPFRYGQVTYRLPVRYYLFAAGDVGSRRRFVAKDHALIMNSNGQVHAHWTPAEFRHRSKLNKLADRILVVVDTDPLPLAMRSSIFTADRTELLRSTDAVRLEEELIAFLDDWDDLRTANADLIREAIRRSNVGRSTAAVALRIARALQLRPVMLEREPSNRNRRPSEPRELLADPTELVGPKHANLVRGRTTGVHFSLNAMDDFLPIRATCRVETDHLDIEAATDVTVGAVRNGRLRVTVAVPPEAELSTTTLVVEIEPWLSPHGALLGPLRATIPISVIEPDTGPRRPTPPAPPGTSSASADAAPRIALLWGTHHDEPSWTAMTVGEIHEVDADELSTMHDDYADLKGVHGTLPVVKLNEEFAPLKQYVSSRARHVGDEGVARNKERYAAGVGVQMMLVDGELRRRRARGDDISDDLVEVMRQYAARGVLMMLPDIDAITDEVGIDGL